MKDSLATVVTMIVIWTIFGLFSARKMAESENFHTYQNLESIYSEMISEKLFGNMSETIRKYQWYSKKQQTHIKGRLFEFNTILVTITSGFDS